MMKKFTWIAILGFGVYLLSYGIFRTVNSETWAQDGQTYVIFPADNLATYYLFRPMSYLDEFVTGRRAHIGPHVEISS